MLKLVLLEDGGENSIGTTKNVNVNMIMLPQNIKYFDHYYY